jgi:hypothetical protein
MPSRKDDTSGLVPLAEKKFTLLWIPRSGLFYDGGKFLDGDGNQIRWNHTIPLFATHAKAATAKNRVIYEHPNARGEVMILGVTIKDGKAGS